MTRRPQGCHQNPKSATFQTWHPWGMMALLAATGASCEPARSPTPRTTAPSGRTVFRHGRPRDGRLCGRGLLGAIAQFEKTSLVAKLKAARDRKKAATGKCGGRKTYAEASPDVVLLAKQMHDQGMSLRKISAELAARGYVTAGGKPYVASAVQTMLG